MITLVVASRNRSYTLQKVLPSYFTQEGVTELILVDDDGEDDAEAVLRAHAAQYSNVKFRYMRNDTRRGASYSRGEGARYANNPYILFCDDDEYLEPGYAAACLALMVDEKIGVVSGRRVYMRAGETPEAAVSRFGSGPRRRRLFDMLLLEIVNGAHFKGTQSVPFTIANFLTRKELVLRFPLDSYYARGNGYREESDFQMNLYVHGYTILINDAVHSIHLPIEEVRTGGQRTSRLKRLGWSIYYNNYFIDKYHARYRKRAGVSYPGWVAKAAGVTFLTWKTFLRPPLYKIATSILYR